MNDKANGKALGIIETMGLIPSVEAGDVAVKTADVRLIGIQAVGGGLVSILMTGDVSAVKASMDAAQAAAARLGEVLSVTVIARTAEGLDDILVEEAKCPTFFPQPSLAGAAMPEMIPGAHSIPLAPEPEALEEGRLFEDLDSLTLRLESGDGDALCYGIADLKKLKVTKLRRLARQIPIFSIARGEIKFAKKSDLLDAFIQYMKSLEM